MPRPFHFFCSLSILIGMCACNDSGNLLDKHRNNSPEGKNKSEGNSDSDVAKNPADFVSKDLIIFDKISGDLNNDGQDDCILITKGTDSNRVVLDEYFGEMDRNRRGIVVLFKDGNNYELVTKNDNCFSSENEDGGVYFPPELSVEVKKGKLFVNYAHGRYGSWKYTFRHQDNDFKLIGYDQTDTQGPIMHYSYSYNFLTKKKQTKENINFYSEHPEDEDIKETWEDLKKSELISLSAIKDFDDLDFD